MGVQIWGSPSTLLLGLTTAAVMHCAAVIKEVNKRRYGFKLEMISFELFMIIADRLLSNLHILQ